MGAAPPGDEGVGIALPSFAREKGSGDPDQAGLHVDHRTVLVEHADGDGLFESVKLAHAVADDRCPTEDGIFCRLSSVVRRPDRSAWLARAPAEQEVNKSAGKFPLRRPALRAQTARVVEPKGPAHSGRGKPVHAGAAANGGESNESSR